MIGKRLLIAGNLLGMTSAIVPALALGQHPRYRVLRMPTAAMEPTLHMREILTFRLYRANGASLQPGMLEFQDIVLFHSPSESTIVAAKRIIGLPGDTLQMKGGSLSRNGHRVEESYVRHSKPGFRGDARNLPQMRVWQLPFLVNGSTDQYHPDIQSWGPLVVPANTVALLGDNRDESYDTRYFGFVPFRFLLGRLQTILDPDRGRIRWNRDSVGHAAGAEPHH